MTLELTEVQNNNIIELKKLMQVWHKWGNVLVSSGTGKPINADCKIRQIILSLIESGLDESSIEKHLFK